VILYFTRVAAEHVTNWCRDHRAWCERVVTDKTVFVGCNDATRLLNFGKVHQHCIHSPSSTATFFTLAASATEVLFNCNREHKYIGVQRWQGRGTLLLHIISERTYRVKNSVLRTLNAQWHHTAIRALSSAVLRRTESKPSSAQLLLKALLLNILYNPSTMCSGSIQRHVSTLACHGKPRNQRTVQSRTSGHAKCRTPGENYEQVTICTQGKHACCSALFRCSKHTLIPLL
jgi:hypothetical protein